MGRFLLLSLLLAVSLVSGCAKVPSGSVGSDQIPDGTAFMPLSALQEFQLEFSLHIRRNPDNPQDGIVTTVVKVTPREAPKPVEGLRLAVWLSPSAQELYPKLPLTNESVDMPMAVPGYMFQVSTFFPDFTRYDQVQTAIAGPAQVKLQWQGGVRYIKVPASAWVVSVEQT
jgi:hypothetical protein